MLPIWIESIANYK